MSVLLDSDFDTEGGQRLDPAGPLVLLAVLKRNLDIDRDYVACLTPEDAAQLGAKLLVAGTARHRRKSA